MEDVRTCIVLMVSCYDVYLLHQLLLQAEDDGDAKAASKAKAEQVAEMAEFDENFSTQYDEKVCKEEDIYTHTHIHFVDGS